MTLRTNPQVNSIAAAGKTSALARATNEGPLRNHRDAGVGPKQSENITPPGCRGKSLFVAQRAPRSNPVYYGKFQARCEIPPAPLYQRGGDSNVFSWFQGVPEGHEELLRKDLMGCAPLHPSYGSFRSFRVSRRDVKSVTKRFDGFAPRLCRRNSSTKSDGTNFCFPLL